MKLDGRFTPIRDNQPDSLGPEPLLDRGCVMLDGKCDCERKSGQNFPECKKYGKKRDK